MWGKFGGVANNLRSTVTQLANDFVDRTEELSQQADRFGRELQSKSPEGPSGKPPAVSDRLTALKSKLQADKQRPGHQLSKESLSPGTATTQTSGPTLSPASPGPLPLKASASEQSSTASQAHSQDQPKQAIPASTAAGPEALSSAPKPSARRSHTSQPLQNAPGNDAALGSHQHPAKHLSRSQPPALHVQDANGNASPSRKSERDANTHGTGSQPSINSASLSGQHNMSSQPASQTGPAGDGAVEEAATGTLGLPLGNVPEQPASQPDRAVGFAGDKALTGRLGLPLGSASEQPVNQLDPTGNAAGDRAATGMLGLPLGDASEQPANQLDPAENGGVERAATGKLGLPLGDAPEQAGEAPPLRRKSRTPEQRKGAISWQQGPNLRDSLEPAQTDLPLFSPDPAYRITPHAAVYPSASLPSDSPAGREEREGEVAMLRKQLAIMKQELINVASQNEEEQDRLVQGHAREVAKLKASLASGRVLANGTTGSPRSKHPSAWTAMQKEHQMALSKAVSDAQEAAARELAEAKGTWEARGQRQRSELREMDTRLERQEQAHQRAATSLQHDVSALQERLTSSQVELASRPARDSREEAEGDQASAAKLAGLGADLQKAQQLHQKDATLISDLKARLLNSERAAGDAAAQAGATAAKLRHELEEQKQECSQLHKQLQVLQQQLEDRGAGQQKENTGHDLEAELAEIGEVLEGVEEERDALQQQVDRLEASAFQSANQAREHEEQYRASLEAARAAEADQKQQVSKLGAQLAEQSQALQSTQQQLATSQANFEAVQHDLVACQARLADAQSQANVGSKAAEADLQQQVKAQQAALQELQQRWEASTQESSSLQHSLTEAQEELAQADDRAQTCQDQLEVASGQLTEALGQLAEASSRDEGETQEWQIQVEAAQSQLTQTLEQLADASNRADDLQGQLWDALGQLDSKDGQIQAGEHQAKLLQEQVSGLEKKLTEAQEQLEESYAEGRRAEGQLQALQKQLTEGQQHTAQLQADLASRSAQLAAEHQELAASQEARAHLQQRLADLDGQQASAKKANLEQQLAEAQRLAASLQDQVDQLHQEAEGHAEAMSAAARSTAAAEAAEAELEQQLQQARSLAQRTQADLEKARASAAAAAKASPPETGGLHQDLQQKLQSAEEAAMAAAAERDHAKQQLSRLKAQMVEEQEEEEGGLQWRIDAEVRLALQEAQAGEAARLAELQAHVASLEADLEEAKSQEAKLKSDIKAWQEALPARDIEIQNLQVALGELTYENEARERNRIDLKAARAEIQSLQSLLASAQTEVQEVKKEAEANAAANSKLRSAQAQQQDLVQRMQEETAMLRRVVRDNMKRLSALDDPSGALVDRRLVVKLLLTYFERDQAHEVLELMARILGLSEEDVRRIRAAKQAPSGMLRAVAAAPFSFIRRKPPIPQPTSGPTTASQASANDDGRAKESIADQWIDFLLKQARAAGEEADQAQPSSAARPSMSSAIRQETPQPGDASTAAPDALEMMASSPPGGFAPASNSPFQPSFSPLSPSWQLDGTPQQPQSRPQQSDGQKRQPIANPEFNTVAPSQPPMSSWSPSAPGQHPRQHQSDIFGAAFSPPAQSSSRGPSPSEDAADKSSHASPGSLHAAGPSLSPLFLSGDGGQAQGGVAGHAASYQQQQQQQTQAQSSAYSSAVASGAQQGHEPVQQAPLSPWQPRVAAAGPSWLQPATWQAAGGAGRSWLPGTDGPR